MMSVHFLLWGEDRDIVEITVNKNAFPRYLKKKKKTIAVCFYIFRNIDL